MSTFIKYFVVIILLTYYLLSIFFKYFIKQMFLLIPVKLRKSSEIV